MQSAPLSILHIAAPARFGGLESVVRMLAAGHAARGHRVHVLAVLSRGAPPDDHPFVTTLRDAGVSVTALAIGDRQYLRERSTTARLCRTLDADVVHTHGFRPDVVDSSIARRHGARTVSTVHGFIGGTRRARLYERLQRRVLRRLDAVAAVSAAIAETLLADGVPSNRLHLVPNAFAPDPASLNRDESRARLGVADDSHVIGWVGRTSREKGLDVALRAFAALGERRCTLAIVGDGAEAAPLRALAAELGVDARVRWLGAVPGAGRLFAGFDTFLLSSRTEGTPMVLLEAMAAGVPIVATAVGGVPDLLRERDAWLVPSEDVSAMTAALRAATVDPAAAATRATAARRRLEETYGITPWLARYEDLYRA